ncbi:GGDEF domain-containing response regulator [Pseudoalteromonas ostreae]|uniref:GGDEF domain-containing response regulator n=1 Tax=Pseudoalteromonas ostreae TaxID=2774154 RepID=UPI001B36F0D3|nr:diguanylate cyclase [Pseudoalteromonas ostreae]
MHLALKPLTQCKILIVDDDEIIRVSLQTIMEDYFEVETLSMGSQVLDYCKSNIPDLILLDVNLPGVSGLEICTELKQNIAFEHVPIVFITASYDTDSQNACWEAGATDFISKPVTVSTLIHRTKNHVENKLRLEVLMELTYKDSLTGLYNRHYLEEEVGNALKQSEREKKPFSVLMIDIDHFKLYNDHYGHLQGDICLKQIANVFADTIKRPHDVAIRFGGEEFLIVLPYTDLEGMTHVCKQIILQLNKSNIEHSQSSTGQVTVSIGGVTYDKQNIMGLNELISLADEGLYCAKRDGRNCYKLQVF